VEVSDNQMLFDWAYTQYTCEPIVLSLVTLGKTVYEVNISPTIARKVLEWYFNNYVDEIKDEDWSDSLLCQALEEFTQEHTDTGLTKVNK